MNAARVVSSTRSADIFGPKVVRASAGSIFHIPTATAETDELAQVFARSGLPVVVGTAHGGEDCFSYLWPRRCILVLGHETRGISAKLGNIATSRVTIPLDGRAESLNVAAAGTVLLFAWRQSLRRLA